MTIITDIRQHPTSGRWYARVRDGTGHSEIEAFATEAEARERAEEMAAIFAEMSEGADLFGDD